MQVLLRWMMRAALFGVIVGLCGLLMQQYLHDVMLKRQVDLTPEAVYLWGDSRVEEGILLPQLEAALDRPVVPFAAHGNGIYDFCYFAAHVPDGAHAVIGVSLLGFARPLGWDNNVAGLSLGALVELGKAGYPAGALWRTFLANRNPIAVASSRERTPFADQPESLQGGLEKFQYAMKVEQASKLWEVRWRAFKGCLGDLTDRGVRVLIVELPVTERMQAIRRGTPYEDFTDRVEGLRGDKVDVWTRVELPAEPNPFHDASHLNQRGAAIYTEQLTRRLAPWSRGAAGPSQ